MCKTGNNKKPKLLEWEFAELDAVYSESKVNQFLPTLVVT